MKKHTIFYGAGKNARDNYEKWISSGTRPVCFVDKDVSKHYTKFETSDIDILPLDDAIRKYPDYEIHITPVRHIGSQIVNELVNEKGIDVQNIKFFESVEYRKGCQAMGPHFLTYNKIGCCCVPIYKDAFEFEINPDYEKNYEEYLTRCSNVYNDWRNNHTSICDGCPNLTYGLYDIIPEIRYLNISSKDGADYCNAKCVYCPQYPKPEINILEQRKNEVVNMLETAHRLYPNREFRVVFSGGDIAVAPFRDNAFYIVRKYNWGVDIYSSSVAYCQQVAEQLKDERTTYVTTLDSTMPDKYAEIKGVDCLPKVLDNIRRYSAAAKNKEQVKIKLIALDGIYNNFSEIKGIVDFAYDIGAQLMLSCNVHIVSQRLSEIMFNLTYKWIEYAKSKKVSLEIMYDHFNIDDAIELKKVCKSDCCC